MIEISKEGVVIKMYQREEIANQSADSKTKLNAEDAQLQRILAQLKDPEVRAAFARFVETAPHQVKVSAMKTGEYDLSPYQTAPLRSEQAVPDGRGQLICRLVQKLRPKLEKVWDELKREWLTITIYVMEEIEECFESPEPKPSPSPSPTFGPEPPNK